MREHPNPLLKNEADAVAEARRLFYEANPPDEPLDLYRPVGFTVPADTYELIEMAYHHWPTWDLDGSPIVSHVAYVRGSEPREHLLFKGVCMFRGDK